VSDTAIEPTAPTSFVDTLARLKPILNEMLGALPDKIEAATTFGDDLGADSLDKVEVVMAVEEEFKISIGDDDAEQINTVGDLVSMIDRERAAR
jgi:acyl carrier protein